MENTTTLNSHELKVLAAMQYQRNQESKYFKRGNFATLMICFTCLKLVMLFGALLAIVAGVAVQIISWGAFGACMAFFAIVFAHVRIGVAIAAITATFAMIMATFAAMATLVAIFSLL